MRASERSAARVLTAATAALLLWIPLQTPVAIVAYQYLHVGVGWARALLLLKDAFAALLFVYAAFAVARRGLLTPSGVAIRWFDVAALAYTFFVAAYSVLPALAGSKLPLVAVAASFRELVFPVELYLVGRLLIVAGVRGDGVVRWFLGVAVAAAFATVAFYLFVPVAFWASTLDLVTFEREVQGISSARTLWDISLLGQYGVGDSGTFARAVGPFTHPVGTAHYFVVPSLLALALALTRWRRADLRRMIIPAILLAFAALAVITPISRGSWIALGIGVSIVGFGLRRFVPTMIVAAIVVIALVLTPPFSYSISSVFSRADSSAIGHEEAIKRGVEVVTANPGGLGVGQSDHFGSAFGGEGAEASAGVGENMYLATFVAVGPLGLVALLAWMVGSAVALWPGRGHRDSWIELALFASLCGFAVSALTASPLMRFTTSASFWLLLGVAVGMRAQSELRPRDSLPVAVGILP